MRILSTIIILFISNIAISQIDYSLLKGSWTECIKQPITDTIYMVPSINIDSTCKQSYHKGYFITNILTQYNFIDSVNIELTTSHGTYPDSNAPIQDTTQITRTKTIDTTWTENGEIKEITETVIEIPLQIRYSPGTSSMTIENSIYSVDKVKNKLIINQGDRKLKFEILRLTENQLILVILNK